MFQNISKNMQEETFDEDVQSNKESSIKQILKANFTIQNCIIYVLAFMASLVRGTDGSIFMQIEPFGFAIIAASIGARIPAIMVCILSLIGTSISFGASGLLTYILTLLIFFVSVLIRRPKQQEEKNEKIKVGGHITFAVLIVQLTQMFFKTFMLYDFLQSIMLAVAVFVLYKIFVNALEVLKNVGIKKVFSIEEVTSASLLLTIAITSLGGFSIFGFSVRNILAIFIILVMGWKNGMLFGATTGIIIGTAMGIITGESITIVTAYAISGMVAGILNKLGKIGVIIGFVVGNIVLSYLANGNTIEIIKFQEILIAALGLLAMPKNVNIKIEDLVSEQKLLPETTGRVLEENKETINKLNNMSDTISQMAKEYGAAAATVVTDEEIEKQEKANRQAFEEELRANLEEKEDNLLYEYIYNNQDDILEDIFKVLLDREVITRKDIIQLFAKNNNYIIGFGEDTKQDDDMAKNGIDEMVRTINSSYRVSKINFIWRKKLDESKKNLSNQLTGVSEAISNLAQQITVKEDDPYKVEKEKIQTLLREKEIELKDITIKKEEKGRTIINLYTDICENVDGKQCKSKKIAKILSKVFGENMVLQKQRCALRVNDNICMFTFTQEDKFNMQVGIAKSKKAESIISGDTTIQTRLEDGKYLLAISDGMGSGPEARKSSKIAIKMLERLLTAGFNKDTAIKLINTTISANTDDDMYATLDVNILDLYNGNMEFIKNGACPTFIKRNKKVEVLNSVSLPTGIIENIDLVEYNYDLEDGDIIVMCSDGILDSNKEYANKALWIQELLEDLETDDSQRIADIILSESKDNDFGKEKDDMTVITCKISKK